MSLHKDIQSYNEVREHDMNTCFGGGKQCWHNYAPNVRVDRPVVRFKLARSSNHEAMSDVFGGAGRDGSASDEVPMQDERCGGSVHSASGEPASSTTFTATKRTRTRRIGAVCIGTGTSAQDTR